MKFSVGRGRFSCLKKPKIRFHSWSKTDLLVRNRQKTSTLIFQRKRMLSWPHLFLVFAPNCMILFAEYSYKYRYTRETCSFCKDHTRQTIASDRVVKYATFICPYPGPIRDPLLEHSSIIGQRQKAEMTEFLTKDLCLYVCG